MDWRERVNAEGGFVERGPSPGDPGEGLPRPPAPSPLPMRRPSPPGPVTSRTCLYIGASGERCNRPATRGDFCSRHSAPDLGAASDSAIVKRAIAVGGVIVVLWPIIVDLIRALLHLLR